MSLPSSSSNLDYEIAYQKKLQLDCRESRQQDASGAASRGSRKCGSMTRHSLKCGLQNLVGTSDLSEFFLVTSSF
jgi:hypothetical protein